MQNVYGNITKKLHTIQINYLKTTFTSPSKTHIKAVETKRE